MARATTATKTLRTTCLRCRRPHSECYCALIPALPTKLRVVFVQHPRERVVAINTARMAHLALPNSTWVEGIHLDDHPTVAPLLERDDVAVLFPGEGATPLEVYAQTPPKTLIVLDGTWSQAKKLLKLNPRLAGLPRLSYAPPAPGNYRIRKEPSAECLATVEAVAAVVGTLEGDAARFAHMLQPFSFMVERQLQKAADNTGEPRRRKRKRHPSPLFELLPLLEQPGRAVLLYGEANCHGRDERVPGAPEVVHLLALRPHDGAAFEAVLKPRRPLGTHTAQRLGLSNGALQEGESVTSVTARFRAFFDDKPSQLVAWGPYARDLLVQEGEPVRGFVDLRALAARALGGSSGGIDGAARALDVTAIDDVTRGRRTLHLLRGIYAVLLERCAKSAATTR